MIFLFFSSARHGVESCAAIRPSFASRSARSSSSGVEKLKPCASACVAAKASARATIGTRGADMNGWLQESCKRTDNRGG